MRRNAVVAGTVLALALVFLAVIVVFTTPTFQQAPEPSDEDKSDLFRFEGDDSGVWPYLSHTTSFRRQSPINLVVRTDADTVVRMLQSSGDANWNTTSPEERHFTPNDTAPEAVNFSGTAVVWGDTDGADRFAYVHDGEEGQWVSETGQLHNGDYFGHRTHIRLYESPAPDEPWTAMQVHTEHFDWFTLRHSVDGVEEGQRRVEAEFMNLTEGRNQVRRVYLNNDGISDADGWATLVELLIAFPALMVGMVSARNVWERYLTSVDRARVRAINERLDLDHGLLFASVIGIVLGVRAGGILLEWTFPTLAVHAIAAMLYPFIGLGIPIVTYAFSHQIRSRMDAAVTASGALGIAFLVDYGFLGVHVLPIEIVLQRFGVVVALGLIAGGAAQRASRERRLNKLLVGGIALWVGLLGATLLEWI